MTKNKYVEYQGQLYLVTGIGIISACYEDSIAELKFNDYLAFTLQLLGSNNTKLETNTWSYTSSGDSITHTSSSYEPNTITVSIDEVVEIEDPKLLEILDLLYN